MSGDVAAFLVILDKNLHPDQASDTIAAARQLKGVVAVHTRYDEQGIALEILGVRSLQTEVRTSIADVARAAGGV